MNKLNNKVLDISVIYQIQPHCVLFSLALPILLLEIAIVRDCHIELQVESRQVKVCPYVQSISNKVLR